MGEEKSYAVGHFAFGYILGKASAKFTKTGINIPMVFVLSILPDVDIIIGQIFPFFYHRGPLHSIITLSVLFIPVFAIYRVRAVPYFLALIQHPLLGDFLTAGPVQLFWPVSRSYYGILTDIEGPVNVSLEWVGFAVMLAIMVKRKDIARFFHAHNSNLILAIPTFTVLLPTFLSIPLDVPVWLVPPHLFFIVLFLVAMLVAVRGLSLSVLKRQIVELFSLSKR